MSGELKERLEAKWFQGAFVHHAHPTALRSARTYIEQRLGNATPKEPNAYDLIETYRILRAVQSRGEDCSTVGRQHLRRSPWVLLHNPGDDHDSELAADEQFLANYLRALSSQATNTTILSLAHVFLRSYPTDCSYFSTLRIAIARELRRRDSARVRRLRGRCESFGLLEEDGASRFGKMMHRAGDYDTVVADAGLTGDLGFEGFIVAAVAELLSQAQSHLRQRSTETDGAATHIRELTAFLVGDSQDKTLRFPVLRTIIAETLLLPFVDLDPTPEIRNEVSSFLLDYYGDPRLGAGRWHGVDNQAQQVLFRWLVSATLRDFFRIVSHASRRDSDADRMWPYREAFWRAYLEKGVISDAWVVLGRDVRFDARRILDQYHESSYGVLESGYLVRPSHAVLILRIGDLIVTEWSHSGKYRIWRDDNPEAPKFYQERYKRMDLVRNPDDEGAHNAAERGSWQRRVAVEIERRTAIRVTAREYMPRD